MQPGPAPVESIQRSTANVMPRPTGLPAKDSNDAPAEPVVRMLYIELSVSGVMDASAGAKLTHSLDKLKASRGCSVKCKGDGEATVKVWYSEREPLTAEEVIETVTKLGFKAVPAG